MKKHRRLVGFPEDVRLARAPPFPSRTTAVHIAPLAPTQRALTNQGIGTQALTHLLRLEVPAFGSICGASHQTSGTVSGIQPEQQTSSTAAHSCMKQWIRARLALTGAWKQAEKEQPAAE